MKKAALDMKCTNGDARDHADYDNCWFCAPYWVNMKVCPIKHGGVNGMVHFKLNPDTGYCRRCKKYYDLKKCADCEKTNGRMCTAHELLTS